MDASPITTGPKAATDVVTSAVGDDLMVYDFSTHRAHCLAPQAAAVFSRCDGTRSAATLSRELGEPRALVDRALAELAALGLVTLPPRRRVDLSRRRATRKLAVAAVATIAAPLVWSIVAPSVAEAASVVCVPPAGCTAVNQCCTFIANMAGTCIQFGAMLVCSPVGNCFGDTCR